jgi:four helix bundle protein
MSEFNQKYCHRAKCLAVDVIKFFSSLPKQTEYQIIGKQLFRSGTSVAANFRAASRARSGKEYYSKLSLVVEECDETIFWLELLEESKLLTTDETSPLRNEAEELLKIFASTRKTVGTNLK